MILPIVAYGDPILKQKAVEIDKNYPQLKKVIADMFDTMNASKGVGLAAPQVALGIRLFIVDASPFADDEEDEDKQYAHLKDFKKVFINPTILEYSEEKWGFEEGCLSIPTIREEVSRPSVITMKYWDENFKEHEETFDDLPARIIQHEYDHIEGKLFVDYLNPLKKKFLKKKLNAITHGDVKVSYKMKFPKK